MPEGPAPEATAPGQLRVNDLLGLMPPGGISPETRHRLSAAAFRHTASYDNAVYSYLQQVDSDETSKFPEKLEVDLVKGQLMREKQQQYVQIWLQTRQAELTEEGRLHINSAIVAGS